jgi:hypothetical protein
MDYPIPMHLKDFFQLVGENNSEFEATGNIKCSCGSETFSVIQSNDKMIVKLKCHKCNQEITIFDWYVNSFSDRNYKVCALN